MSRTRVTVVVAGALLGALLPMLSTVAARSATTADAYLFDKNPIAQPGQLANGTQVVVTLTSRQGSSDLSNASVSLYTTVSGGANGTVTVNQCGATTNLTGKTAASPAVCTTDANGHLSLTFTAGNATSGLFTIVAEGSANNGPPVASTSYDYTVPVYRFSSSPIAAPTTLTGSSPLQQVDVTVLKSQLGETANTTIMKDQVFLSLKSATTGGAATATAIAYDGTLWTSGSSCTSPPTTPANPTNALQPQAVTLSSTPTAIDYGGNDNDKVIVCFDPPASPPSSGTDVLTIQKDGSASPSALLSTSYSYAGAAASYSFSTAPIAAPGTLGAAQLITVTVKPLDTTGAPIAGLPNVFLSGSLVGSAVASVSQCGTTTALTATPASCMSDGNGALTVRYRTASPLPATGADSITVQNLATAPTVTGTTGYSYATGLATAYSFSPSPIAPSGSLAANATKTVTLTAKNGDAVVPFTTVYLWEKKATGGGTASVAGCGTLPTTQTSAIACATDAAGTIAITYKAPSTLPTSGEDAIEAQRESGATPTVGPVSVDYSFAPVQSYGFSPSPIAPTASLGANQTVSVTLTAKDANGAGVSGAVVFLTLTGSKGASPAGSASVTQCGSDTTLDASPSQCTADATGHIAITYKTPGTLPPTGTDTITAASQSTTAGYSNPAVVETDTYAFNPLAAYTLSPTPIAPAGSIEPGGSVPVTLTATRANGTGIPSATVYLSLTPATGVGSANVTQCGAVTSLSATPVACTTNADGKVTITYRAPSPATKPGTATITAQDAATAAASSLKPVSTTYTLLAEFGFERLAGADRYETAAAIARAAFPSGSKTAVLTTGANFPDALAGAFLAGAEAGGAPILLTTPTALSAPAATALDDLEVEDVIVLGGTAAVSEDVVTALTTAGYTVTRIAGETRYDTMKALVEHSAASVATVDGKKTAILATGENFPDALGAGPIAYGNALPIVLTNGKQATLLPQARDALTGAQITQVVIVGGTAAINPGINAELTAMGITILDQAAGADRSATSSALATWAVAHKLAAATAIAVANGCRPSAGTGAMACFTPDSLAGAPYGGSRPSPVPTLITRSPTDPGSATSYAESNRSTLEVGVVYGGTGAVADSTLAAIEAAMGGG